MPPLMLMIALDCNLRIVEAIDLGMEWRRAWPRRAFSARDCAECWYNNKLGGPSTAERLRGLGTYAWPPCRLQRYAIKR